MAAVRSVILAVFAAVLVHPSAALLDAGLDLKDDSTAEQKPTDSDSLAALKRLVMQLAGKLDTGDTKAVPVKIPEGAEATIDMLTMSLSDPAIVQMFVDLKEPLHTIALIPALKGKIFGKLAAYGITEENLPAFLSQLSEMVEADPRLKDKLAKLTALATGVMSKMESP
eukprot:TRINITY_DN3017_c0_g1_i2.p2 TRINITY_DN3017_c0_g1~~TRINITY_DN3017_c0_g1_i2.p2  ORF type:complete len:196 (+),score=37.87 TRINITY_DN3017_c0_g1_i2:84-590(+)